MAIEKFSNRNAALASTKEEYVRTAAIMASCDQEDVLIVKAKLTEEEARKKVEEMIANDRAGMDYGVEFKLIKALRAASAPTVHKEYYSVIASYFHVSALEYDYSYHYNGNIVNMSPRKATANMDFCAGVETLDGRYKQDIMGKRTPLEIWDNLLESECCEDFEEGFKAHNLLAEDSERESKESMRILNIKLQARMNELVQEDLGTGRRLEDVNILDKTYTYVTKVLAAPFYIFNFDLGKQIVTISVDAYSGVIGTPIINNPLGRALFAKTGVAPSFSIVMCIICGVIIPGFGAVLYALSHFFKKMKYENSGLKEVPKYKFEELKALI